MAAAHVISVEGQAQIERVLAGLLKRFGNLKPLMERFGIVLEAGTIERFDTGRGPDGTPWLPSLRARTTGGKTLVDRGILRQSIRSIAGDDRVEIGSNIIYARIHQEGGTIAAKGDGRLKFRLPGIGWRSPHQVIIPARPFLGISADDRDELIGQAEDWIAEAAPEVER